MKFYFCEGCGKRITDKEIDAGLGKDKKLKGVYCKGCAAGVMTLDTMPMSDEQARKILADSSKDASPKPKRRSTSTSTSTSTVSKAKAPAGASGMNFYFCEGCGKRVTDKDIQGGLGKNKKLKGVYCKGCAVGVSTMDALPMSDEQARQILVDSKSAKSPAATRRRARSSSPISSTGKRAGSGSESTPERVPQSGSTALFVGIGIGLVVIVGLAALFLSKGDDAPKRGARHSGSHAGGSDPKVKKYTNEADPNNAKTMSVPAVDNKQTDTLNLKREMAAMERGLKELPPDDWAGRIALAQKILSQFKDASETGALAERIRTWKKLLAEKQTVANVIPSGSNAQPLETDSLAKKTQAPPKFSDATAAAAKAQIAKSDAVRKAKENVAAKALIKKRFDKRFKVWLKAFEEKDESAMALEATGMAKDAALIEFREASVALGKATTLLANWRKKSLAGFPQFKGKEMTLQTLTVPRKGRVVEVTEVAVKFQLLYMINKRPKLGPILTIPISELKGKSRTRFFQKIDPATPDEWVAYGLLSVVDKDIDRLREALPQCKGRALFETLEGQMARLDAVVLERKASVDWMELKKLYAGATSRTQSTKLLDALLLYETTFATTAFLGTKAKRIVEMRNTLKRQALRSRELVEAGLFGKVLSYENRGGRFAVLYDFKESRQLSDFMVIPYRGGRAKFAGGSVGWKGLYGPGLEYHRLAEGALDLAFSLNLKAGNLVMAFGDDNPLVLLLGAAGVSVFQAANPKAYWKGNAKLVQEWKGTVPVKSKWAIQLKGAHLVVQMKGTKILDCESSETPRGGRIAWGGRGIEAGKGTDASIDDVIFRGAPMAWWLEEARASLTKPSSELPLNLWTNGGGGGGGDGNWATASNWSLGRAPAKGDHVVFKSGAGTCKVSKGSVPATLAGLTLGRFYKGHLIFDAGFGPEGSQELVLAGDLILLGGRLTVTGLVEKQDGKQKGVGVTIRAANVLIGSCAVLDSDGRGFPVLISKIEKRNPRISGSHGGYGDYYSALRYEPMRYGAANQPVTLGAGGGGTPGGGAIKLISPNGTIRINGEVRCNSFQGQYATCSGAGGSIWIQSDRFFGGPSGRLEARGGHAPIDGGAGGGGRIAVACKQNKFSGQYDIRGGVPNKQGSQTDGTLALSPGSNLTVASNFGLEAGVHKFGRVTVKAGFRLWIYSDQVKGKDCLIQAESFHVERGGEVLVYVRKRKRSGSKKGETRALLIETGDGPVQVNGSIRIEGGPGGLGGHLLIRCGTFSGTGSLSVRGGSGGAKAAGGAGGRVAVRFKENAFAGKILVDGGSGAKVGRKGSSELKRK